MAERTKKRKPLAKRRNNLKRLLPTIVASAVGVMILGSLVWLLQAYWPEISSLASGSNDPASSSTKVSLFAGFNSDYASPEAVFEANKRAIVGNQHKAYVECFTAPVQEQLLKGQVMVAAMRAKDPSQRQALNDLIKKYGGEENLSAVRDKGGLFHEARQFCDSIRGPIPGEDQMRAAAATCRLENLRIDGDRAEGESVGVLKGEEQRVQRSFARTNGEWKISNQ